MGLPKFIKQLFTFQETRVELGFVLAWDEPEELRGTKQKEGEFLNERFMEAAKCQKIL